MQSHKIPDQARDSRIRQKMLCGEPFTYSSMAAWAQREFGFREDEERHVDRLIRGLHTSNIITFSRRHMAYVPTVQAAASTLATAV